MRRFWPKIMIQLGEEKLRQKITELRAFRKEGVRKIDDCREFEVNKMKRERRKREEKVGHNTPY